MQWAICKEAQEVFDVVDTALAVVKRL